MALTLIQSLIFFYSNFHLITKCAFIWCTGVYYTIYLIFCHGTSSNTPAKSLIFCLHFLEIASKMWQKCRFSPKIPHCLWKCRIFWHPPQGWPKKPNPKNPPKKNQSKKTHQKNPPKMGFLVFFNIAPKLFKKRLITK